MNDVEQDMNEIMEFDHSPISPFPRKNHIGEETFHSAWLHLMGEIKGSYFVDYSTPLHQILSHAFPYVVTQRHATVAASFICWLGTNSGRSIIDQVGRCLRYNPCLSRLDSFRLIWAKENSRRYGFNNGYRLIEYILGDMNDEFHGWQLNISVQDYEVCDRLIEWLADVEGTNFINSCLEVIEDLRQKDSAARLAKWKMENLLSNKS